MKKKSLLKLIVVVVVVICASVQLKAQEVEVTGSELFLRSENDYGVLKFYDTGHLLLDKSSSTTSDAFGINVGSSSIRAICVRANWASPAVFEVLGTGVIKANGMVLTSDSKEKDDIQNLDSQIENLKKLKGVSYNWKDKDLKGDKKSYGLLAQDLEKVFPDMVFRGDSGEMGIYYIELIPVLLEVANEQQNIIEYFQKKLDKLEIDLENLKGTSKLKSATISDEDATEKLALISQNIPNPFRENCRIDIFLPENINNAILSVYNMQGTQIRAYNLNERGNTNVTIEGNTLKAGMYLYTLIADGKEVDTQKMILTK